MVPPCFFHRGIARAGSSGSGADRVISSIVPVRTGFVKENRAACGDVPGEEGQASSGEAAADV